MLTLLTMLAGPAMALPPAPSATMTQRVTVETEENVSEVEPAATKEKDGPALAGLSALIPRGHVTMGAFLGAGPQTGLGGAWFDTRGPRDRGFDFMALGIYRGLGDEIILHGGSEYEQLHAQGNGIVYTRAGYQYDLFGQGSFDLSVGAFAGALGTGEEDPSGLRGTIGVGGGVSIGAGWHPGRFRFEITSFHGLVPMNGTLDQHEWVARAAVRILGPVTIGLHSRGIRAGSQEYAGGGFEMGLSF